MRLFTIMLILCIASCTEHSQSQWLRTEHSLTPQQIERQQQIIRNDRLLFEYDGMIGKSAEGYSELISLANVTGLRGSEKLYTFVIPRANDDGSDATFHFVVERDRITKAEYWSFEY